MVDRFRTASLLANIYQDQQKLRLVCNSGTVPMKLAIYLEGYGTFWFHSEGSTKILSLSWVKNPYQVTYDRTKIN